MLPIKMKYPTFLTIFTEEPWVDQLYDILSTDILANEFVYEEDKCLSFDEVIERCFKYSTFLGSKEGYQSLDVIEVLKWAKEKATEQYYEKPGYESEEQQIHDDHIAISNNVIALYMTISNYLKPGDYISCMSLELPDVVHITVQ